MKLLGLLYVTFIPCIFGAVLKNTQPSNSMSNLTPSFNETDLTNPTSVNIRRRRDTSGFKNRFTKELQRDFDKIASRTLSNLDDLYRSVCSLDLAESMKNTRTNFEMIPNIGSIDRLAPIILELLIQLLPYYFTPYYLTDTAERIVNDMKDASLKRSRRHPDGRARTDENLSITEWAWSANRGETPNSYFYIKAYLEPINNDVPKPSCSPKDILLRKCPPTPNDVPKPSCSIRDMLLRKCPPTPIISYDDDKSNFGIFMHYTEFKFNYKGNDKRTIERLREDASKFYSNYNMIKSAVDNNDLDLTMPSVIDNKQYDFFRIINYC